MKITKTCNSIEYINWENSFWMHLSTEEEIVLPMTFSTMFKALTNQQFYLPRKGWKLNEVDSFTFYLQNYLSNSIKSTEKIYFDIHCKYLRTSEYFWWFEFILRFERKNSRDLKDWFLKINQFFPKFSTSRVIYFMFHIVGFVGKFLNHFFLL